MMSSSKGSSKITRSSSSAGEDVDHNSSSSVVTSDATSNSAATGSPASSWYAGGGGYGYPTYPSSPQQPGAYPAYPQWNPYTAHYPGYGGYTGWDYSSGSNATAPPPPPGSTSVTSPLPAPPPPPPSTTSNKPSTESRDKSSSSDTKLPQPPLPPLPPPAFGLPPPPPPGPPPPPSSLAPPASTHDEPKPKEKESREERKRRKKEKKKKEREERERDRAHRSKHEKTSSSDGIPTVKSYAAALKESSSSKEEKVTDSKNKSSSKEETQTCAPPPPPAPPAVLTSAAAATSPSGVSAVAGGVVFPPPDFSKPPPPPPPPPLGSQDQSDSKLGLAAETSGHPPLQPPPMPPPYGAFDLNVPPPGFTPPNFPPPKHGFHNMGGPGAPGGPPGPYGGGFANNWYDGDQRGGPPGNGRFGRPGGPYNSPFGKPPGEDEGGQHGARTAPYDEIGEGRHPSGGQGAGHIKFNFPVKNSFTKQNALLETPPTKPQWNPNRLGGDIRGGMYRDSPMMEQQGERDNAMGPRGPNRRNLNNWRSDMHSEGVIPGPGGMRDEQTATPKPLMARLENTNFGGKVPSKDSLAKGGAGPGNKQQQSQQDVANMMKGEWPDALKRYVERCFAKCVTDLDKDQVEIVLKGKLTAAAKTGTLWTHKWDAEPMPSVHSDDMFTKIRNKFPTRSADTNSVSNSTTTAANNNNNSITGNKGSPDKRSSDLGGRGRRGHRQHGSRFSRSRSRSRSRSPYGRDTRHRRDSRRRYSPSPDDSCSTNSNNVIPLSNNSRGAKRGRGSAFSRGGSMSSRLSHTNVKDDDSTSPTKDKETGEPKLNAYGGPEEDVFGVASPPNFKMDSNKQPNKKMRMDGKEKDPRNDIYFYSKGGKMTLDADLSTAAHLQKRAARFQGMMSGGGTGPAAAAPAPPVTAPSATPPSVGRGRGNRGGLLGRRGRGRGRGAAASVAAAVTTTPSIVATINASLFAVDTGDMDWTAMHVVGTCTEIKKQYLRLTSAPDPSTVRTLATLFKSLDFVKNDWVEKKDYRYTCNQMKSIRQDLTVQGIRDIFTIQVYEAHCRIALETADHEEFNQCQSQLKQLYAEVPGAPNALEFMAYRMLYYIFTKNTLDMTSLMAELTPKQKADECIAFALNLRGAWAMSNYYRFFKLFQNAPKMAGYLVDWFAERERKTAIKIMVKGYVWELGYVC